MSSEPNLPDKPEASAAGAPKPAVPESPQPAAELTPEEQMENFARQLKEDDWGHQPC
ncbi:MAG TPA: hypothetical protein VHE13_09645 [Opitutus sp.]|nr:hypothetical protein [Opitutus sp.]